MQRRRTRIDANWNRRSMLPRPRWTELPPDSPSANWYLAVPTAKPATKWLLNMASENDRKALTDAAAEADKQIKEARLLYKKTPTTTTSAPATRKADAMAGFSPAERKLETTANQLAPFAAVMATAMGSPSKGKEKMDRSAAARCARQPARGRQPGVGLVRPDVASFRLEPGRSRRKIHCLPAQRHRPP